MSLLGEVNRISGDVRRAVESIARKSVTDIHGNLIGTKKILGYVCAIHSDGDLAGTIDVQEFNYEPGEYEDCGTGHHKGVLLSAIQNNDYGFLIVPMLYSEVVIVESPMDGNEYVLMYSQAQKIQLSARSLEGKNDGEVKICVTEVEDFVETNDGLDKDCDELAPTNNQSSVSYTSASVTKNITSKDDIKGYTEQDTVEGKVITIGTTTVTINKDGVTIKGTNVSVESDNVNVKSKNCEVNSSSVTVTGGNLNIKGTSSTDLNGPFNAIKVCPFSGAPHCGSSVSGT